MIELKAVENNTKELLETYKLSYFVEKEEQKIEKFNQWDSGIITKYIVAEQFGEKYIYKDYADFENSFIIPSEVFNINIGDLRIYNEELKLFENLTDDIINTEIEKFFNKANNIFIRKNCCKASGNWVKYKQGLVELIKQELNNFCKENRLHWSNSFEKNYIGIVLKNGTLFLKYKEKQIEFKKEHNPRFLAEYRIDVEYNEEKFRNTDLKDNHFFNFLKFKLMLDNAEKMGLFLGMFFDLFYTANQSQHILFISGKGGTGKTSIVDWFRNIQYGENWSTVKNLDDLTDKFTDSRVYNLNYILSDEVSDKYITNNAMFKSIISKGTISTEQKFKDKKTIKSCAKIIAVGEKIPDIKQDGGVERRFCYLLTKRDKFKIPENFLNLEEYLNNRKNEDFLELLVASMFIFSEKKYFESKTAIKDAYDKIFAGIAEEIALNSISYVSNLTNVLVYKENSYIEFSALVKIFKVLFPDKKQITISTFSDWLENTIKKIDGFKGIKIIKNNKDIKVNGEIIFKLGVTYVCNISLNIDNVRLELLDKVHKIAGTNTSEQLNNLLNAFKEFGKIELTEKDLQDLTEEEREEKIDLATEKARKTENLKLDDLIKSIK